MTVYELSYLAYRLRPGKTILTPSPRQSLIPFALDALDQGFENALRRHYNINGIGGLQREWQIFLDADGSRSVSSPVVEVSFKP